MTPLSSLPLFIGLLFLAHISVPHEVSVQEMHGDVISQRPVCSCYISLRKKNTGWRWTSTSNVWTRSKAFQNRKPATSLSPRLQRCYLYDSNGMLAPYLAGSFKSFLNSPATERPRWEFPRSVWGEDGGVCVCVWGLLVIITAPNFLMYLCGLLKRQPHIYYWPKSIIHWKHWKLSKRLCLLFSSTSADLEKTHRFDS